MVRGLEEQSWAVCFEETESILSNVDTEGGDEPGWISWWISRRR
jgi:hypothetical protein